MLLLVVGASKLDIAAAATLSFGGSPGGAATRRETQREVEGMFGCCQMLSLVVGASKLDIAAATNLSFGSPQRCYGSIGALLLLVVAAASRRFCSVVVCTTASTLAN